MPTAAALPPQSALPRAAPPGTAAALAPLREELLLHRAPSGHDGAPAWTLEDPGRNQFFQIGWAEAEMLARWHLGAPQRVAEAVSGQTTLDITAADVEELARFLDAQSLLQMRGAKTCERYQREAQARHSRNWASWALHNYLFVRIPLVRPDAFLERTLPWVRCVFLNRRFALATALTALLGLFLVTRRWDAFVHTFLHFFTPEGAAIAALTLACTKVLHELGHAYVSKHHGCRVASMGVAFMVLWPVLYTDTSGAWRLASRRQRMAIGAAGMLTETALAAWATLAWSFLPDGVLRSAAFMLATTTWLLTLAVNLNPLMRFDGYFLLADALNVPNLQNRSFALARWRLREWLFGFGDDKPEVFAPWRERTLIVYAFCVWVYRFFLFLGIALLVYHFAFKLLGILLFAIEIMFFVIRPIFTELKAWVQRLRAGGARWNRRSACTAALLTAALLLLALPWHARIAAPALARAAEQARLVAPTGARIEHILAEPGQAIAAGKPLFVLSAPDLEHELNTLRRRMAVLAWQSDFHAISRETATAVPVAQRELQAAGERLAVLERQQAQLTLVAPFDGILADRAEPLATGDWVAAGEWLGTLAAPEHRLVEAYITENELHRVRIGDAARFVPEDPGQRAWTLRVIDISATATRRLTAAPELASPNGGGIAAERAPPSARAEQQQSEGGEWVPEQAVYRVLLQPNASHTPEAVPLQVLRGTTVINGQTESLLHRAWRQVTAVLVRESGF
ncbi:HlyD family efflux transporter periplasmic adaptor subunit [Corticibacter populi]|uniref:HlyD family efflux transporter periplasmic adaptor subunit n=1 Tax=Corticibacter populi TaxID=1550736 RepID=A0A3M6QVF6_9BURK|nr:HlyD family efflux transporter periplasmic adaptor subunit [Corticibacter populi]RMX06861.1 HlyD family efflux transporter periplasmic adaptor subunit [Corticibacter populi]RZS31548.1 putative peptide zinc metalloprotease protein [Corticibacter populi]